MTYMLREYNFFGYVLAKQDKLETTGPDLTAMDKHWTAHRNRSCQTTSFILLEYLQLDFPQQQQRHEARERSLPAPPFYTNGRHTKGLMQDEFS
jgi:hypothetical protein